MFFWGHGVEQNLQTSGLHCKTLNIVISQSATLVSKCTRNAMLWLSVPSWFRLVCRLIAVIDWCVIFLKFIHSVFISTHMCCVSSFEFLLFHPFPYIYICCPTPTILKTSLKHPICCLCDILENRPIVYRPQKICPNVFRPTGFLLIRLDFIFNAS